MSVRYLAALLMGLGIAGMTVAVVWWYNYYMELKELLDARTPPPVGCLYRIIEPCRFSEAVPAWSGWAPYRPELLWIAAASFAVGSLLEFLNVARRELGSPDQVRSRDFS